MARKVMLITGGSRGIGAATARLAAGRGWDVAVNYVAHRQAAERVVAEVEAAGGRAIAVQADVAIAADVGRMFTACDEAFGRLDGLVNSAGIVDRRARIDEMDAARIERMMAINVTGSFLCAIEATRRMSTRHGGTGGTIVNVSSAASRLASAGEFVDYAASKAAIDIMTIGLAREVADEAVRVNAVRPGLIETEIHASTGEPDRIGRLRSAIPMQRAGTADEVAETILWLASDAASYVTGALVDVSGGR